MMLYDIDSNPSPVSITLPHTLARRMYMLRPV